MDKSIPNVEPSLKSKSTENHAPATQDPEVRELPRLDVIPVIVHKRSELGIWGDLKMIYGRPPSDL